MLKSNVKSSFLSSFKFFDALYDNFNKTVDESYYLPADLPKSARAQNFDATNHLANSTDSKAIKLDVL